MLLAQLDRALRYERKGWGFESLTAHHLMWDALQRLHDRLGKYLNGKKHLSWSEAKRWNKLTQVIMWCQERIAPKRCEWKKLGR